MPRGERSEEAWAWYSAVYEAIQEIPHGRVTSYGHIARLVGKPECPSRGVPEASALAIDRSQQEELNMAQRQRALAASAQRKVVSVLGPDGARRQASALRAEGVEVEQNSMREYTVDLSKYGWFPDMLPSEAGQVESSDEEDEEEADAAAYHT